MLIPPCTRLVGANAVGVLDASLSEEFQYLDLLRDIIEHGEYRPDRTGTGTLSLFAPAPLRFQLSKPAPTNPTNPTKPSGPTEAYTKVLPLLTTRRLAPRLIIAELLWFISGCTSSLPLQAQNIHIWDGNGSRSFLDSVGLTHHVEGDLGPVYGFQWRHSGAAYRGADEGGMSGTKYEGEGVDQLAEVVRLLQTQPASRRILMSAWNVADLGKMALPPCHLLAQFYVSYPWRESGPATSTTTSTTSTTTSTDSTASAVIGDEQQQQQPAQGVLHATLYQRSADSGLGLPFNIASYALLTHMLAHVCHLRPGTLTVMLGDAHVYLDHVETLKQQLLRAPKEFPELRIGRAAPEREGEGVVGVESMEGWTVGDFEVCGYEPHGRLDMKMSV